MQILATPRQGERFESTAGSDSSTGTLLFFHIGKTGGTSLTRYFQSLARTSYVQPAPEDFSWPGTSDDTEAPDFISGHYKVDPWLQRMPRSWRTMVVIRNPVLHLLSTYWHIRTHPPVDGDPDLNELIANTRRDDLGTVLNERAGQAFELHFDNPQTRFILDKRSGSLDADDLARAAALLDSLDFVGTTERLGAFAVQVAALTPWAVGWENQVLPRVMTNPLNTPGAEGVPRSLLRHILAATEFDAELHQQARRLQLERLDTGASGSTALLPSRVEPVPVMRGIAVADLVRVYPVTLQNVRVGIELCIDEDKIFLHPPLRSEGFAGVTMEDIPLDGHSEIAGRLVLENEHAAAVLFGVELSQGIATIASGSFKVAPGQRLDIRLRFLPTTGPVRLELRTEMALENANDYAWATFVGLTMK